MKKLFPAIILIIILASIFYFAFSGDRSNSNTGQLDPALISSLPSVPLVKEYQNATYKFSLKMPMDFTAREIGSTDSKTVLLEGKDGQGIQILISPFDDIKEITAEMIHTDIPDLKIIDSQIIEVEGHKGISFQSDNQSFAGASAEIWFVFRGNLYQISTYKHMENVLQDVFASWKFF